MVRVGPPSPGATRELGILAMQLSPIDIRLGGRLVNAAATSFMHPNAWKVNSANFAFTEF
jgi:hypothetical protein